MLQNYKQLYKEAKKFYFGIGKIPCSAFEEEPVPFGKAGWRHVVWKQKVVRPIEDRLRRFELLRFAEDVIRRGEIIHYREDVKNGVCGKFWRLHLKVGKREIKVVIRQIGLGPKHFFSIMD